MANTYQDIAYRLIAASWVLPLLCCPSPLVVKTSASGAYDVYIEGQKWLGSASTFLRSQNKLWSTQEGTLVLSGKPSESSGSDIFGSWNMVEYQYKLKTSHSCAMNVSIKSYPGNNMAIFSQIFPDGLHNSSSGDMNGVISSFPSFKVEGDGSLGLLSFDGLFTGYMGLKAQRFTKSLALSGGLEGGPLVLFNKSGPALVVSAFSEFMSSSMWYNKTSCSLHWGVMGKAYRLPKGYGTKTILFYSRDGINKAVSGWGEALRLWYKKDTSLQSRDLTVTHLGYYTDNGAFFYHNTYPFFNYEEALLYITHKARALDIPYRYIQYDDWWYFIRGPGYGATVRWEPMPSVFPHGLKFMLNKTGLPVLAHNRYWSSHTPYAKQNGGKFEFTVYQQLSMPEEQSFWDWLFGAARSWGLVTYEQDWLNYQTERIFQLHSDVGLASQWLRQMGAAALRHNLTLQYCMALPRHVLQSLEIPAVTQVRVSLDYHLSEEQWRIGISSMFASAVGLAPFKDNFWSLGWQPGNPYNKSEKSSVLEAVVSILSTGPVAPGGLYSDPELISRLHRRDGLLLKPARPALAIDAQIYEMAFADGSGPQGEVWTSHMDVGGLHFGIIFAANLTRPYEIGPSLAGFSPLTHSTLAFPFTEPGYPIELHEFSDDSPLKLTTCTTIKPCLVYTTPSLIIGSTRLVILGELDKFVRMSPQRVRQVTVGDEDAEILISGVSGETVEFSFRLNTTFPTISCRQFGPSGLARIHVLKGVCRDAS